MWEREAARVSRRMPLDLNYEKHFISLCRGLVVDGPVAGVALPAAGVDFGGQSAIGRHRVEVECDAAVGSLVDDGSADADDVGFTAAVHGRVLFLLFFPFFHDFHVHTENVEKWKNHSFSTVVVGRIRNRNISC